MEARQKTSQRQMLQYPLIEEYSLGFLKGLLEGIYTGSVRWYAVRTFISLECQHDNSDEKMIHGEMRLRYRDCNKDGDRD